MRIDRGKAPSKKKKSFLLYVSRFPLHHSLPTRITTAMMLMLFIVIIIFYHYNHYLLYSKISIYNISLNIPSYSHVSRCALSKLRETEQRMFTAVAGGI